MTKLVQNPHLLHLKFDSCKCFVLVFSFDRCRVLPVDIVTVIWLGCRFISMLTDRNEILTCKSWIEIITFVKKRIIRNSKVWKEAGKNTVRSVNKPKHWMFLFACRWVFSISTLPKKFIFLVTSQDFSKMCPRKDIYGCNILHSRWWLHRSYILGREREFVCLWNDILDPEHARCSLENLQRFSGRSIINPFEKVTVAFLLRNQCYSTFNAVYAARSSQWLHQQTQGRSGLLMNPVHAAHCNPGPLEKGHESCTFATLVVINLTRFCVSDIQSRHSIPRDQGCSLKMFKLSNVPQGQMVLLFFLLIVIFNSPKDFVCTVLFSNQRRILPELRNLQITFVSSFWGKGHTHQLAVSLCVNWIAWQTAASYDICNRVGQNFWQWVPAVQIFQSVVHRGERCPSSWSTLKWFTSKTGTVFWLALVFVLFVCFAVYLTQRF